MSIISFSIKISGSRWSGFGGMQDTSACNPSANVYVIRLTNCSLCAGKDALLLLQFKLALCHYAIVTTFTIDTLNNYREE